MIKQNKNLKKSTNTKKMERLMNKNKMIQLLKLFINLNQNL